MQPFSLTILSHMDKKSMRETAAKQRQTPDPRPILEAK